MKRGLDQKLLPRPFINQNYLTCVLCYFMIPPHSSVHPRENDGAVRLGEFTLEFVSIPSVGR